MFDKNTPEDLIAEFVESVNGPSEAGSLADLLPEEHPLYAGRGTNQTARIRGYILAAFARAGLPDTALPYVLDELENGIEAYLVAAAAIALRGSRPGAVYIPYLLKAVRNMRYRDDSLTFECYRPQWPVSNSTTALTEIFRTFAWLGSEAAGALAQLKDLSEKKEYSFSPRVRAEIDEAIAAIESAPEQAGENCCAIPPGFVRWVMDGSLPGAGEIEFEDQDGKTFKYAEYFSGKPSIVVFFYTRCDNPNKCSLTVTKLAQLQKELRALGLENDIKTAAITYDPGYDLPFRSKIYGSSRGVVFDDQNKMLRTPKGLKPLQEHFRLGVNFTSSIVNRHRIELFVLDELGNVRVAFGRSQWKVREVVDAARSVLEDVKKEKKGAAPWRGRFDQVKTAGRQAMAMLLPFAVVFFPKCPLCWAAYLSLFGITSLSSVPYSPWLLFPMVLLMLANLASIFQRGKKEKELVPFYLSSLGVFIILFPGMYLGIPYISFLGLALIFTGSNGGFVVRRFAAH